MWVPGACGSRMENSTSTPLARPRTPPRFQPPRPQPSRQPRKDKVSGVLMDAGLSRWLLALGQFGRRSASQRPTASRPRTPVPKPASRHVQRAPASRRRYALTKSNVRAQPARQRPAQPPPVTLAASLVPVRTPHRFAIIERPPRNQRPQQFQRPRSRCVRARLRCSSRASLPFSPQAGTPTAIIGMRPATSLRTKTKLVDTTPSGCRASWVLLRVQCCPRPYRPENALSIKKCERAFSGR